MNRASSTNCCHGGSERIVSMKTTKSNFSGKQYDRYIKAFLRRKPAAKTDDFSIIPVYCGFGTLVYTHPIGGGVGTSETRWVLRSARPYKETRPTMLILPRNLPEFSRIYDPNKKRSIAVSLLWSHFDSICLRTKCALG